VTFPHRHFFPAILPLVARELPTRQEVRTVFETAGFTQATDAAVRQVVARNWASFAHKSSLRADSFLARLSDLDFETGMLSLRAHAAARRSDEHVVEDLDWYVFVHEAGARA
jgi:hypothetical protein